MIRFWLEINVEEKEIKVLDKGFIRVVDTMGDDSSIVQAARVSYGKGTKKSSQDRALIRYLMRHRHTSPFEMCEIKLHIKMPIFIARQWVRHRTANINEYSARYSILEPDFYIPNLEDIALQSETNKQGREGASSIPEENAAKIQNIIKLQTEKAYKDYNDMIEMGVAREIARIILPANIYTEWYWKCDLHNFLHFIALRASINAQLEIRKYAQGLLEILQEWLPMTYEAFMDYRLQGSYVSKQARKFLQRNENINEEELSQGEWAEFEKDWPR